MMTDKVSAVAAAMVLGCLPGGDSLCADRAANQEKDSSACQTGTDCCSARTRAQGTRNPQGLQRPPGRRSHPGVHRLGDL